MILAIFEAIAIKQTLFYVLASPIILGASIVGLAIIGTNIRRRGFLKAQKLLLPALLALGVIFLILFETSSLINQIVIWLSVILFYFFFVFYQKVPFSEEISKDEALKIRNYFQFAIIFTAFLGFLAGYFLLYMFNLPLVLVTLVMIIVSSILFYYLIWLFEGALNFRQWLFVILLGLLIAEFFFVLAFWPISPWIASTLLVLLFYLYFGMFHLGMEGKLEISKVWEYLIVIIIILLVIINIMKWNY